MSVAHGSGPTEGHKSSNMRSSSPRVLNKQCQWSGVGVCVSCQTALPDTGGRRLPWQLEHASLLPPKLVQE